MTIFEDRRRMASTCLWIIAMVLLEVMPARADTWVGDSLELTVADSDLVIRGKLETFVKINGSPDQLGTVQVEETLKGDAGKTIECLIPYDDQDSLSAWRKNGTELLVCLVKSTRNRATSGAQPVTVEWSVRHGDYDETGIIPLDGNAGWRAPTLDFEFLKTPKEILQCAVQAIQADADSKVPHHADGSALSLIVGIPSGWPMDEELHSMSSNLLVVPMNEMTEAAASKWVRSDFSPLREDGVFVLSHFKSDANVAAIKSLLTDPDAQRRIEGNKLICSYPIRAEALAALEAWGVTATATIETTQNLSLPTTAPSTKPT